MNVDPKLTHDPMCPFRKELEMERLANDWSGKSFGDGIEEAALLVESWATNIETPPAAGWKDDNHRGEAIGRAMLLRNIAHAIRSKAKR